MKFRLCRLWSVQSPLVCSDAPFRQVVDPLDRDAVAEKRVPSVFFQVFALLIMSFDIVVFGDSHSYVLYGVWVDRVFVHRSTSMG